MSSPNEGDPAPAFELPADGGGKLSSTALAGKPYVIYFYPKDDTPGCTKEAIGFSCVYDQFKALGVEVIGVSKDSGASHDKFKKKHELMFPLASDESGGRGRASAPGSRRACTARNTWVSTARPSWSAATGKWPRRGAA